jgi:hypothetical protein
MFGKVLIYNGIHFEHFQQEQLDGISGLPTSLVIVVFCYIFLMESSFWSQIIEILNNCGVSSMNTVWESLYSAPQFHRYNAISIRYLSKV